MGIAPKRLEGHVLGLQHVRIAGHHRREGGVDGALDVRPGAKTGAQRHAFSARRLQHLVYAAINSHVGAPETIDRLLRVADQKELPGNRANFAPVRLSGIVGRQQQQDLGLQRIGVLKLVDEDPFEALLKARPHLWVIPDEISRLEQKIEKVERAGLGFCGFIRAHAAAQFLAQRRREIGIGIRLETGQSVLQVFARPPDILAQDAAAIIFAAAFARVFKLRDCGRAR